MLFINCIESCLVYCMKRGKTYKRMCPTEMDLRQLLKHEKTNKGLKIVRFLLIDFIFHCSTEIMENEVIGCVVSFVGQSCLVLSK